MNTEKKKLLLAYLVSFAVAVVGAIIWGIVFNLGVYASIVSYISAFAMYKVFLMFHESNRFTFLWIIGVSVILNIIACIVAIALEYPDYNVFDLIQSNMLTFGMNMFLSIIFTLSGAMSVYKQKQNKERHKSVLTQYEIEKIKRELKDEYAKEKQLEENKVSEETIQELKDDMKNIENVNDTEQVIEEQVNAEDKKDY